MIIHEFIKRLHARYQQEGIDNSSPTETVVYLSREKAAAAIRPAPERDGAMRAGEADDLPDPAQVAAAR